jgi:hypothetical protein
MRLDPSLSGTDVSVELQRLIDTGDPVELSAGRYQVKDITLHSGTIIYGTRDAILEQIPGSKGSTTRVLGASASFRGARESTVADVKLSGFSLRGQCESLGFLEHEHLILIDGSSGLVLDGLHFIGFRGDGVLLNGGISDVAHNTQVVIKNCCFDGVNYQNRNGVSVIDADGVVISQCVFRRCSSRVMPGAVDFEPDFPYNVIANATVDGCTFLNIGGNVGVVALVLKFEQGAMARPMSSLTVMRCTFDGQRTPAFWAHQPGAADSVAPNDLRLEANRVIGPGGAMYWVQGIGGVVIAGNATTAAQKSGIALDSTRIVQTGNMFPQDARPLRGVTFGGPDRVPLVYYPGAPGWLP